ncbi:hypothetical protein QJS66_23265 [Kocuria rhizophila]|nr:hypothetical protein QJS66_23265 [Kocuria rhizophila]
MSTGAPATRFAIFPGSALFRSPGLESPRSSWETSRPWACTNAAYWAARAGHASHVPGEALLLRAPLVLLSRGAVMASERLPSTGCRWSASAPCCSPDRPRAVPGSCSSATPWWR